MQNVFSHESIHKIARFLLINSEVFGDKNMTLIYFLFCYSHHYKKQHYANFAFGLLEESMSKMFIDLSNGDMLRELDLVENGWCLIQLVRNDFFESDGLDDILRPYDGVTVHLTETLSRGVFNQNNVYGLLCCAGYLIDRIEYIDKKDKHYFLIKEHLLISFFELIHNIDRWNKKDARWGVMLERFLEMNKRNQVIKSISKSGLRKLVNIIDLDENQIMRLYSLMQKEDDLNQCLLLSLCFTDLNKRFSMDIRMLLKKVETKLFSQMETLYKIDSPMKSFNIQEFVVYALVLLKEICPLDHVFLIYATYNLTGKR